MVYARMRAQVRVVSDAPRSRADDFRLVAALVMERLVGADVDK
jgi:hypothetical protein